MRCVLSRPGPRHRTFEPILSGSSETSAESFWADRVRCDDDQVLRKKERIWVRNGFHDAAYVMPSSSAKTRQNRSWSRRRGANPSLEDKGCIHSGTSLGVTRWGWTSNRFFCGLLKLFVWQSVAVRPEGMTRRAPHNGGSQDSASISSPQCPASQSLCYPTSLLTCSSSLSFSVFPNRLHCLSLHTIEWPASSQFRASVDRYVRGLSIFGA